MTDKERDDYFKLTPEQREMYDDLKRTKPHWSHNQIIFKIKMDATTIDIIDKKGGTLNPETIVEDPSFLKQVLEGTKNALYEAGIFIAEVFEVLDNAISQLRCLIMSGVRYIGNKLSEFWDWLTS